MEREVMRYLNTFDIIGYITSIFFFILFIGIVIWVLKMDKKRVDEMSHLPLDDKEYKDS